MDVNMLKLNDDKMDFIMFVTHQQLLKTNAISVHVGGNLVDTVSCICSLGNFMDKWLKNTSHINKITSTLYLSLLKINKIRDKLDFDLVKTIVQALIKMDYCNSLLCGTPTYQLNKIQQIENMACRVVCRLHKFYDITDSMSSLHWLRIEERFHYKIAMLSVQVQKWTSTYISGRSLAQCQPGVTMRSLRSSTSYSMDPAFCRTSLACIRWILLISRTTDMEFCSC